MKHPSIEVAARLRGECGIDVDDGRGNRCVRVEGHIGKHTDDTVDAEYRDFRNAVIEVAAQTAHDVQRNAIGLDGAGLAELIADTIRERRT